MADQLNFVPKHIIACGKNSAGAIYPITVDNDGKIMLSSDVNYKGWYATEAALLTAYPTGEDGWYAIVGTTDTVWVWDSDTSAWVDSGLGSLVTSVNGRVGNVTGLIDAPASTDNALSKFDGTSGALQNTGVIVDDNNNIGLGTASPGAKIESFGATADSSTYSFLFKNSAPARVLYGRNDGYIQGHTSGVLLMPTLRGSEGASGTLTLQSSSNATKGKIIFGTSGYDEVNNRLGIGTTSPSEKLEVIGTVKASGLIGITEKIELRLNGNGFAITTGIKRPYYEVPWACTITKARVFGDQSATATVDILRTTYTDFDAGSTHPVAGDKISASAPMSLSAGVKSEDSTLTGWTKTLAAGDVICPNVLSNNNAQYLTLVLEVTRA